ncbi:MAG: histidine kinase [Betaproteobacteria bacterium]
MKTSLFFIARRIFAWMAMFVVFLIFWTSILNLRATWPLFAGALLGLIFVITTSTSHLRRIRLIAGNADASTLANRQRRQIEMPFEADEAFDIVDATFRELPRAVEIESARDSLQIRAKVQRANPYGAVVPLREQISKTLGMQRDLVFATVTPRDGASSVTVICEPENGAWSDLFVVDDGVNLENAEAITRAISRRIAERRRNEQASTKETVTEKELAVAKLGLLHAQVEPHFLYNTLGSAKYLIKSDPVRAEEMLDNLILYLRHSLPRTEDTLSTIADELERARAYLDILQIRMGARLRTQIDVPDALKTVPFPTMMLQTLVENAIKHGLEPKSGGGTIWILARSSDHGVAVTVADDGRGFSTETAGTGIGLKNVRERLKLAYGGEASFSIVANFPNGIAATITVPVAGPIPDPTEVNHG